MARYIVIGDSFAAPFGLFRETEVQTIQVPGLLAGNPCTTMSPLATRVKALAAANPDATVIFIAGNLDLQVEMFRQAVFHGLTDFKKFIMSSVRAWCDWIRALGLPDVVVCGAVLPTVNDAYHSCSVNGMLHNKHRKDRADRVTAHLHANPVLSSLAWRVERCRQWNAYLQAACKSQNASTLKYADMNEGITLNKMDGSSVSGNQVDYCYRHPNPANFGLLWEPMAKVWQQRLAMDDSDLREPLNDKYLDGRRKGVSTVRWVE